MKFIPNKLSSAVAMTVLRASKISPQVLFGAGVVGVIGTAVLASRATLQLPAILEETHEHLDNIEHVVNNPDQYAEYTSERRVKDKTLVYVQLATKIVKLYAPSLAVAAVSIAMLGGSHRILTKRNAALTAAYATIDKSFREYRDRVVEEFGEEKDRHIRFGVKDAKVVQVDENGKKTVVEKQVANGASGYARLFNCDSSQWVPRPEWNIIFLRGIQEMATERLNAQGFLLLNDVYKDLGIPQTSDGCVVGWVSKQNGGKDGYVDFYIFDNDLGLYDYLLTDNGEIWLDFNVDGNVQDLIDKI